MRSIGTLGSALTFAGQATEALRTHRGGLAETSYFATMDEVAAAVLDGAVDLGVLTSETSRTASTDTVARILAGDKLYVVDEIVVPYRCALLGKPGTRIEDIRHVGGHGSLRQCRDFLAERLPRATAEMHRQNSVVAAREILEGDGTTAVVATEVTASALGLEVLARDVDRGSLGGWWALAARLEVPAWADHLALGLDGADELELAMDRARELDLQVRTVTNAPTGELFRYRYLVTLRTSGKRPLPERALETFGACVVGAFVSTRVD